MNAPLDLTLDRDAFGTRLDSQERKYEWKEGRVVPMANVTKAHARIVSNFVRCISARLGLDRWSVTASDLGVDDDIVIRFPDAIVEPTATNDMAGRSEHAELLVEVLPPNTTAIDIVEKPSEYANLPALRGSIVVSQDEPIHWIWQRQDGAFPSRPEQIEGRDSRLVLVAPAIKLEPTGFLRGIATVQ
jgi:hypothetical protein